MSEDFAQPQTPFAEDAMEGFVGPDRRRMPDERPGVTHKFNIAGHEGYITLNAFEEDGRLGELFLHGIGKDGSTLRGFADAFAIMFSIALQYGAPLDMIARKLAHMRFDPQGKTDEPRIPSAQSIPDYVVRYAAQHFGDVALNDDLERIAAEMRRSPML